MYPRLAKLPSLNSFFLFGPRGTGKTRLLKQCLAPETTLWIDLLSEDQFLTLTRDPAYLERLIASFRGDLQTVVIDEVQRVPSILNEVHRLIESDRYSKKLQFALTGSSARKLRRGGANLLAGRAFLYHLFPLSVFEYSDDFDLIRALKWGTLPQIVTAKDDEERGDFLRGYCQTYLREEIREEQIVRKIDPFLRFLEVAASANAEIVNFSKIGRQCKVDHRAVLRYFQILEDTLLGFFLEPYHTSVRKRQILSPKFYFFDTGVARALAGQLSVDIHPSTSQFGKLFEHYIILECLRLNDYLRRDFRLFFYHVDGNEIDMIIERPGRRALLVEIKSSETIDSQEPRKFESIAKPFSDCEKVILYRGEERVVYSEDLRVVPWLEGISEIFFGGDPKLTITHK
jgi:predicted AAA+ superfamily ATPase